MGRLLGTLVLLGVLALSEASSVRLPVLPENDPFYVVPENIDDLAPGTILKHRRPLSPIAIGEVAPLNLKASHQILYKTVDTFNASTATVLTVLIPHNPKMGKVLSYQFVEDAASLKCAPSFVLQQGSFPSGPLGAPPTEIEVLLVGAALDQGWVVIVPDYQGPNAAFLANTLAGHAVLDGIRAAIGSSNFTGIEPDPTVALWGYSGGSLVSGWATELQPTYASELKIAGAALGGVIANLGKANRATNGKIFAGLVASGFLGLAHEYPEIRKLVDDQVLPKAKPRFDKVERQCLGPDAAEFTFQDIFRLVKDPKIDMKDPLRRVLMENDLGKATPQIPLYVYKSILDEVSPIADTDKLIESYCSDGASIEYIRDLASAHGLLLATGAPKAFAWLKRVMNGEELKSGCSKKKVVSSLNGPSSAAIPGFILRSLLNLVGRPVGSSQIAKEKGGQ